MERIQRLGGVGYPRPDAVLPEVLQRNYGRWTRHEVVRPGVLKHVSDSGEACLTVRLLMPMGKRLSTRSLLEIAEIAERVGAGLRVTSRRAIELVGVPEHELEPAIGALRTIGFPAGGTGRTLHQIVTCTGFTHCQQAALDGPSVAHALGNALFQDAVEERYPTKLTISVSGCPNQCGQANTADIGVVGIYEDVPVVHDDLMDQCDAPLTVRTCPTHAIRVERLENNRQTVRIAAERCVHCGSCALQCGAIEFGRPGTGRAVMSVGGKGSNTGCGPALGRVVAVHVPLSPPFYREIVDPVRRIIDAWVCTAGERERVRDWIARVGWEKFYQWTKLAMPREALDGFRQHHTMLRSDVRFRW
ncbi:MAG: hypothetical protein HY657_14810 [Acidobacteria bacterium]|nr:hypothetical protein [Acidobacteriota bacterium]